MTASKGTASFIFLVCVCVCVSVRFWSDSKSKLGETIVTETALLQSGKC